LVAGLGGLIERIGDAANSTLSAKVQLPDGSTRKWNDKTPIMDHTTALEKLVRFLGDNVSRTIEQEVRRQGRTGLGCWASLATPFATLWQKRRCVDHPWGVHVTP
jgi:hypothetical protein